MAVTGAAQWATAIAPPILTKNPETTLETMETRPKREHIASAFFGGISVFALLVAIASHEAITPYAILFLLGFCVEGICLALAPEVLFQRVTLGELRTGAGPLRYGAAAVLSVIAKVFLLLALVFWGLSQFSL